MEETIKFLKEWNQTSSEENFKIWCDELRDEGRIEGKNEGLIEGRIEEKIDIAKILIKENFDKNFIIKVTGISEEKYKSLLKK